MSSKENLNIPRNAPCPCGSGKKYKKCCGVGAAPQLNASTTVNDAMSSAQEKFNDAGGGGFDPSQMDPQMMMQMMQQMQKLPGPQKRKLQSVMQKAMSGKDVSSDMAMLEKMLPPQMVEMFNSMPGADQMSAPKQDVAAEAQSDEMSLEEAKKLVEAAAKEGKLSEGEAKDLTENVDTSKTEKKSAWSKLFGKK